MENNIFTYHYSVQRNKEVESIRNKYLPCEVNRLDRLQALDRRVQRAGMIQGLTVGIIGALVFGIGMCFGLDVFAGADWLSVLFGVLGVMLMIPAYPVHRYIHRRARAKLVPEILRLSDEIMKS